MSTLPLIPAYANTAASEDLYSTLRSSLMERARDKESTIRVQAVVALSKLAGSEDISELEDGEQTIMDMLIDCLQYDPAP